VRVPEHVPAQPGHAQPFSNRLHHSLQEVPLGEVSLKCTGKASLVGFGFLAAGREWHLTEP
jgi:hypothetical protein